MDLKVDKNTFESAEKYVFKPTFWLETLMKLICNKLGNEDQHMFQQVIKKKFYLLFVKTYLTPTWNQKSIMKNKCQKLHVFWKTYLKPTFMVWIMKINAHYGRHVSNLVIEMKIFNVPQFYNGFCCYCKSTCSNFDKVIKLFILFCLHPMSKFM